MMRGKMSFRSSDSRATIEVSVNLVASRKNVQSTIPIRR